MKCTISVEGYNPIEIDICNNTPHLLKDSSRAGKLMNDLITFAQEHNDYQVGWGKEGRLKYYIVYNHWFDRLAVAPADQEHAFGAIYFTSPEIAYAAIERFKSELVWYYKGESNV